MPETTITGASDDLIEVDGQISEEFPYHSSSDAEDLLAFSDGTLLSVQYDKDGIWRIKRLAAGACEYRHESGDVKADTFDKATLIGELAWCIHAERGQYSPAFAKRQAQPPNVG